MCGEEAKTLYREVQRQKRLTEEQVEREARKWQEFEARMARERELLDTANKMADTDKERIQHLADTPEAWIWKHATNGNGFKVDFVNCRVWAGSRGGRFTWSVFPLDGAEPELASRIKRLSRMADEFLTLDEAVKEVTAIFNEEIKEENRQFLMGQRCPCLDEYIPFGAEPTCTEPKEAGKMTMEEVEEYLLDRRKALIKEYQLEGANV